MSIRNTGYAPWIIPPPEQFYSVNETNNNNNNNQPSFNQNETSNNTNVPINTLLPFEDLHFQSTMKRIAELKGQQEYGQILSVCCDIICSSSHLKFSAMQLNEILNHYFENMLDYAGVLTQNNHLDIAKNILRDGEIFLGINNFSFTPAVFAELRNKRMDIVLNSFFANPNRYQPKELEIFLLENKRFYEFSKSPVNFIFKTLLGLCNLHLSQNQGKAAEECALDAIHLCTENVLGYKYLGFSFAFQRKNEKAIENFNLFRICLFKNQVTDPTIDTSIIPLSFIWNGLLSSSKNIRLQFFTLAGCWHLHLKLPQKYPKPSETFSRYDNSWRADSQIGIFLDEKLQERKLQCFDDLINLDKDIPGIFEELCKKLSV